MVFYMENEITTWLAHHSDGYFGDNVHNFILGNIKSVEILDIPFVPVKNFNLQKYALESFGSVS